jgi:hypothetical protein
LADEITRIRLNEGEAACAAELAKIIGPIQIELTDRVQARLAAFAQWAADHSVRACPTKPASVAMWVLSHRHLGADAIMDMLAALDAIHSYHGLSTPTHTAIVCRALESAFKAEPPRSWKPAEKLLFAALPEAIKQIIGRRERDRERELRRAQNLAAELNRQLKPPAIKPVEQQKEKAI